jgi:ferric-dicitrate binding protein FerR (iron transport regulator)
MSLKEAQQFVVQFNKGEYTPGEYAAFLRWLKGATPEELMTITDMHESMHGEWVLPEGPSEGWVMQLEQKLDEAEEEREEETVMGDPEWWVEGMRPKRTIRWNSWMSAAAVVVSLSAGAYIYVHQMSSKPGERSNREKQLSMRFVNPRGGAQKELVLEDGSKVWLNAGSVLKYPPHFAGPERLVELNGEAFFEVSGKSGGPFRVLIRDAEVDVLGTFFTVMAYDDEPASRTTLVDGAVKVTSSGQSSVLKPGERVEIPYSSPGVAPEMIFSKIDPKLVLAWKDGIYRFKSTDLCTIMREVARVYDVTVKPQGNVGNPQIDGSLDLNKNLDAALKQLETTVLNKIHFSHSGKLVIASPI